MNNIKIAYITSNYNWDSYSASRCGYEELLKKGYDVNLYYKKPINLHDYNQIWLMDSATSLTEKEYKNIGGIVIDFGLSDPLLFKEKVFCNISCTNDYKLSKEKNYYWYPTSCDSKYHKKLNIDKTLDVLFFGTVHHPIVKRAEILSKLQSEGINIGIYTQDGILSSPRLVGSELIRAINASKLVLDLSTDTSSLPRRIFEASCCGTPVLTRRREDISLLFEEGQEILMYDNFDEIKDILKTHLKKEEELKIIGIMARERCLEAHNISHRISNLIDYINENSTLYNNI